MNTLLHSLPLHDTAYRLGWTLLHSLWLGAITWAIFDLAMRLLRHRWAQARYVAACAALIFMLAASITFLSIHPPAKSLASVTAPPVITTVTPTQPTAPSAEISPPHNSAIATPVDSSLSFPPPAHSAWKDLLTANLEPALPALAALWSAGVALLSLWHLAAWAGTLRLRRGSHLVAQPALLQTSRRLAQLFGIHPPALLESPHLRSPAVIGCLRPTILLPLSFATGLSPDQVQAILAHELAHIRRHDYLVNLLQTLVETLFFYHPAVWIISRRIRLERENCCDDAALSVGTQPHTYAETLLHIARASQSASSPALALHASQNATQLRYRIRRLLQLPAAPSRTWPVSLTLLATLLVTACVFVRGTPTVTLPKTSHYPPPEAPLWEQWLAVKQWSWQKQPPLPATTKPWVQIYSEACSVTRPPNESGQLQQLRDLQQALNAHPTRAGELAIRESIGDTMVVNFAHRMNEEAIPWLAQLIDSFQDSSVAPSVHVLTAKLRLCSTLITRGMPNREKYRAVCTRLLNEVLDTPSDNIMVLDNWEFLTLAQAKVAKYPPAERQRMAAFGAPAWNLDQLDAQYAQRLLEERTRRIAEIHKWAATSLAQAQWVEDRRSVTRDNLLVLQKQRPDDPVFQTAVRNYLNDIVDSLRRNPADGPYGPRAGNLQVRLRPESAVWTPDEVPAFNAPPGAQLLTGKSPSLKLDFSRIGEATLNFATADPYFELEYDGIIYRCNDGAHIPPGLAPRSFAILRDEVNGISFIDESFPLNATWTPDFPGFKPGKHTLRAILNEGTVMAFSNPIILTILPQTAPSTTTANTQPATRPATFEIRLEAPAGHRLVNQSLLLLPLAVGQNTIPAADAAWATKEGTVTVKGLPPGAHQFVINQDAPVPTFISLNAPRRGNEPDNPWLTWIVVNDPAGPGPQPDLNVQVQPQIGKHLLAVTLTNNTDRPYTLSETDLQLVSESRRAFPPPAATHAGAVVPPKGQGQLAIVLDWDQYASVGLWTSATTQLSSWKGPSGPTADGGEYYRVHVGVTYSLPVALPKPVITPPPPPTTRPATRAARDTNWGDPGTGGLRIRLVIPAPDNAKPVVPANALPNQVKARLEILNASNQPLQIAGENTSSGRETVADEWFIGLTITVIDAHHVPHTFHRADDNTDHYWSKLGNSPSASQIEPWQMASFGIRLHELVNDAGTSFDTLQGDYDLQPLLQVEDQDTDLWTGAATGKPLSVHLEKAPPTTGH